MGRGMSRTWRDYLVDILTAATDARAFVEDLEFDDFLANKEKRYAVLRALEIIGEAAGRIPVEWRTLYTDLPWREMVGMRNIVIHHYFGVDEAVVWRTIQEELPPLIESVSRILAGRLPGEDSPTEQIE